MNYIFIILSLFTIILLCYLFYLFYKKKVLKDDKNNTLKYSSINNSKNKKLKILVLQDGAYEKYPEFSEYSKKINKLYCDKWKYDYKFIDHKIDEMPPYWLKVFDINKYINENNYDYILYLDLDAVFYDFDKSIEDVIYGIYKIKNKFYDIYVGEDIGIKSNLNSGVFLFKNTKFSRKFTEMWLSSCINNKKINNKCSQWEFDKDKKKWSCPTCLWADNSYEQGVLNYLYKLYKDNIAVLDTSFFSNRYSEKKSFILHAMDNKSTGLFKSIYENIKKE